MAEEEIKFVFGSSSFFATLSTIKNLAKLLALPTTFPLCLFQCIIVRRAFYGNSHLYRSLTNEAGLLMPGTCNTIRPTKRQYTAHYSWRYFLNLLSTQVDLVAWLQERRHRPMARASTHRTEAEVKNRIIYISHHISRFGCVNGLSWIEEKWLLRTRNPWIRFRTSDISEMIGFRDMSHKEHQ